MFGNTPNLIMPLEFQPSKTMKLFREAHDHFFKQISEATGIPAMGFSVKHDRTAKSMTSLLKAGRLNIEKVLQKNYA